MKKNMKYKTTKNIADGLNALLTFLTDNCPARLAYLGCEGRAFNISNAFEYLLANHSMMREAGSEFDEATLSKAYGAVKGIHVDLACNYEEYTRPLLLALRMVKPEPEPEPELEGCRSVVGTLLGGDEGIILWVTRAGTRAFSHGIDEADAIKFREAITPLVYAYLMPKGEN